ncbi:COL14A1 [Branchiostoma lanceolatum]|uniref:COL14A1 protein n=1 Tax=Branchiostoma lanceolatum TaxID=7740 RepID=A0A8J9WBD5_BRALA|nr:COL14A1 [Branchiostoma lanceolatum]
MASVCVKLFYLVLLGLCFSGVTGSTISHEVQELLRLLDPSAAAAYEGDIVGANGNAKGMYDGDIEGTGGTNGGTDGDTGGTDGGTDGGTGGTDGDTEGMDGDAQDTDGDAQDTDGGAQDTDGDAQDTDGDAQDTDGGAQDTNWETEDTDGEIEANDGDPEDTEGETEDPDGVAEDINGDTEVTDMDGDTDDTDKESAEGIDGETKDADGGIEANDGNAEDTAGETEGTDGDTEYTDHDGDTDADGEDTKYSAGDTEAIDGEDTEGTNWDPEDTEGVTEDINGETGVADMDGYTDDTDKETEDPDGEASDTDEETEGDTKGLVRTLAKKNLARGTGTDGLAFQQSRSQNSGSSACEVPLDLFFLLDGSRSVKAANFNKVKQFAVNVVNSFDVSTAATRVGVLQYSTSNALVFNLGGKADKSSTVSAINSISYQRGSGTMTGAALRYVRGNAAWRGGDIPKVMIVLTDGKSDDAVSGAAQNLVADGVEVFTIGVGNSDHAELLQVANNKQEHVIELTNFNALATKIDKMARDVCSYASSVFTGDHAFEVLRTANQHYRENEFFVIKARLPADGLSVSENWCRDYQRLCAQYGLRPTGCGESHVNHANFAKCRTEYNSDPYINNALGCHPNGGVAAVANRAFSTGATTSNSFGFSQCHPSYCKRRISQSRNGLYYTATSGIVYTVCKGSADACTNYVLPNGTMRSPCVNGDCVDGGYNNTGRFCKCNSGYGGNNCERDVDGCSPNPCDDEATCEDIAAPGTGAKCTCRPGFVGDGKSDGSGCEVPAPVTELSATTTCTNDYMELSIPEDQLTDINLNNLHWERDENCGASTNGSHYIFRTRLYGCGTQVTFGSRFVIFKNKINILGVHLNGGVITREGDIRITSKCKYERHEWVESTFLPIPGGLSFTEEGFGQLEVRLSMFPTRQYRRPYRANQYPIRLRLRQHIYMQLEVQGHGQRLSVLALNCKATMSPEPNDTLQYELIKDGCASDPTLQIYDVNNNSKERFGFEAFRFIREVKTVYVHCEVVVCNAANSGSRCSQGCVRSSRGKRAAGEKVDMRGRHMIYQGPVTLDEDKEAANTLRLVNDEETAPGRRSAPWATLAAGGGLMALALAVLGAAIVLKRSRREKWAYQDLSNMEEDGE